MKVDTKEWRCLDQVELSISQRAGSVEFLPVCKLKYQAASMTEDDRLRLRERRMRKEMARMEAKLTEMEKMDTFEKQANASWSVAKADWEADQVQGVDTACRMLCRLCEPRVSGVAAMRWVSRSF